MYGVDSSVKMIKNYRNPIIGSRPCKIDNRSLEQISKMKISTIKSLESREHAHPLKRRAANGCIEYNIADDCPKPEKC